ncbi:unnamed protein product [Amoebophrya sp. A25]|nr:unnamed protein product [Amoebophrya sp. A25]|eukprot:GSA25T00014785001.1
MKMNLAHTVKKKTTSRSSGDEYDGPTELRHVQNNNPMILWTLRFLLMKKANPNIMNLRGDTPLMTAIRNGHGGDVVASLLESKAYVNYRRRDYPAKLLDDEVEVLKTKLLKTAQKNTVITAKQTAARGLNEVDLIAELQEQEVVVQDDLDRAVREVEMMVDELKDIAGNGKAGAGNDGAGGAGPSRGLVSFVPGNLEYSSALTLAVRSGADAEVIMTLLMQKRPASPNVNCADAEDRLKRTPLHYLCRRKDLALVSVFLQSRCTQGCDPNLPDGLGQTPIYVAIDQRHTEMIKLLGDATTQIMTFKEEIPKLIRNRSHENHVLAAFPQLPRFATLKDRRGRRIQRDPTQVRVDAFDKFGISPLQHAILKRWGEGVRTILQYWPSISFQTGLPLKSAVRLRDVNDVYARQQIVSHLRLVGCDMFPAPDARMATDDQYLRELLTLKDENERAKKVAAGQGKAVQLLMMQVPGHEAAMEAVETRAEGGDGGDGAADGRSSPKKKKKRRQEEKAELEQLAAKAEDPINYYVRRYYNDAGSDENSITFSVRQRDAVLLQVLVPYAASVDQLTAGLFVPNINAECCRILLEAKADPDGEMKQHDAFVADYLEHSAKWYAYPQSSCLRDAETAPTASGRDIHEQMLLAKKGRKSSRWEAGQRPGEADTEAIAENPRGGEENAMGTDTPEQVSEVGDTALVVATPTSPKGTTASGAKGGKNTASKLAVVPQDLGHGGVVNRALLRSLGPHEIISRKNPPPGVSAATVACMTAICFVYLSPLKQ